MPTPAADQPAAATPPSLDRDGRLRLRLDGHDDAQRVDLLQEIRRPREGPAFMRAAGGGWELRLDPGPVDRLEYRLRIVDADGHPHDVADPANPQLVHNPFGDRSVWSRPTYAPPSWVTAPAPRRGARSQRALDLPTLGGQVPLRTWRHPDLDPAAPAPVVVAHDGPAYDDEAGLGHLLDHLAADPLVPPFRAALLGSVERGRDYSASPAWADALVSTVLPAVRPAGTDPAASPVVGVGASLGGLAHLHAAVRHPTAYGALLLQSSSCFLPGTDDVEQGFGWFARVTTFTSGLVTAPPTAPAVPTVMTCGLVEENLANNEAVLRALVAGGWPATLHRTRDAHNMTSWRDALHPHLGDLLATLAA